MKLNVVALAQAKDHKAKVLSDIGEIIAKPASEGGVDVHGSNVLIATYVAPEMTEGGIIRPEGHIHQDRFQGKAGLLLKMGKMAFKFWDYGFEWEGEAPRPGDYVMYRAIDGANELNFRGYSLRLVDSSLIRMTIGNPKDIY